MKAKKVKTGKMDDGNGDEVKQSDVKKALTRARQNLPYKKGHKDFPRYLDHVTVYSSKAKKMWRVKPGCGRKDEKLIPWATDPRVKWEKVLTEVAKYLVA